MHYDRTTTLINWSVDYDFSTSMIIKTSVMIYPISCSVRIMGIMDLFSLYDGNVWSYYSNDKLFKWSHNVILLSTAWWKILLCIDLAKHNKVKGKQEKDNVFKTKRKELQRILKGIVVGTPVALLNYYYQSLHLHNTCIVSLFSFLKWDRLT